MTRTPLRSGALPDLLLLAPCLPSPGDDGRRLRWHHMLKFLGQRYRVHLGCFVDRDTDRAHLGRVKALCFDTCFVERPPRTARRPGLHLLAAREPQAVRACRNLELARWVERMQRRHTLHAALACSASMALHFDALAGIARLADFVELDSDRGRELAAGRRWPIAAMWRREAGLLCQHERSVARLCDRVFFVSEGQAALFRNLARESAHKAAVLPNGVDCDHYSPHILQRNPYPPGCRALLLASRVDDWPQADAAEWFVREVFVRVRATDPGLRLYITGTPGTAPLRALARHDGVVITGPLHDVRPLLAHAALAVAPLHVAAGGVGQVLEALAMQKVLVASPAALHGVRVAPDTEVLVAADAAEFVRRIEWALASPAAREIGRAARVRVMREHSWPASFATLAACLDGAVRDTAPAAPVGAA